MNRSESEPAQGPLRVLFVCTGNTCRSPMAEVLSRHVGRELGLNVLEVRSAGTHAGSGMPASGGALRTAARNGLSLTGHSSTLLTRELVEWADWIFAMGPSHLHRVEILGGGGKAFLLGAFPGSEDPSHAGHEREAADVPDPFGGDDEVYEETFRTLEKYVTSTIKELAGKVGG